MRNSTSGGPSAKLMKLNYGAHRRALLQVIAQLILKCMGIEF